MSEEPMIVTQPQYVRLGAVLIALETSTSLREATRAIHDLKTESFPEIARLRAMLAEARADYEALRRETDGGSESMTHDDAIAEIRGLRDEVERLTRERDEDRKELQLRRVAVKTWMDATDKAEARVAELEAAIAAWAQAHDGTNFSVQSETSAQLRALLSPQPAPCATCGGTGAVERDGLDEMCPDCRKEEK